MNRISTIHTPMMTFLQKTSADPKARLHFTSQIPPTLIMKNPLYNAILDVKIFNSVLQTNNHHLYKYQQQQNDKGALHRTNQRK